MFVQYFILCLNSLLKLNTFSIFPFIKTLDVTFDDTNYNSDLTVEIKTPSLEYLNLAYCIIREFTLYNLPTIIKAHIYFGDGTIGYPNSIKLTQDSQNTKSLSLTQYTLHIIYSIHVY